MKPNGLLTITSVLAILFMTFHFADDIVRGMERGGSADLIAVAILGTWLYGALVLAGRRSGYVIKLLGALLGTVVPIVHFAAAEGVAGRGIAESSGALFFVWVLVALGVTSVLAFALSLHGLWSSHGSRDST